MKNIFYSTKDFTEQAILEFCKVVKTTSEIMAYLGLNHREHFRKAILKPLLESGLLELTIPDKPQKPITKI